MLKQRLFRYLPRHRDSRIIRRLDRVCVRFHEVFENLNYDFHDNGEDFVLRTLAAQPSVSTIFDVGANIGDWAAMAAQSVPRATIHSFEIVPETFQQLRTRCASFATVLPHALGLAEAAGEVDVFHPQGMSANATCVDGITEMFHKRRPPSFAAKVTTGDLFCAEHAVERVDFLKIDVEGFEPNVLRGFRRMLESGSIDVIQFEYGYVNIVARFLLKDFYDFLTPYGMRIGKIYPERVEFRDYDLHDENFLGPNYLAVRSSKAELLDAFAN